MWENQVRWVSFGSCVAKSPIRQIPALLQGDPFAPLAMSLIIAPVVRRIHDRHPQIFQTTYLDDRTAAFTSMIDLKAWIKEWETFEGFLRLKSNPAKSQWCGRTSKALDELTTEGFPASNTLSVLGMTFGEKDRDDSVEEIARFSSASAKAVKISSLPVSAALKQKLRATTFAVQMTWGQVINGRKPADRWRKKFLNLYNLATKDQKFPGGRASVDLRQALFLGHTSDLLWFATLRTVSALFTWARYRAASGLNVTWSHQTQVVLASVFRAINWQVSHRSLGPARAPAMFDIACSKEISANACHVIRAAWRKSKVNAWLRHKKRNDAEVARACAFQPSDDVINSVRKIVQTNDAHTLAIVTGGMLTLAVPIGKHPNHVVSGSCPYCHGDVPGHLTHVLWECDAFSDLRSCPAPHNALARRIGWSQDGIDCRVVLQMALIRQRECRFRLGLDPFPPPPSSPPSYSGGVAEPDRLAHHFRQSE